MENNLDEKNQNKSLDIDILNSNFFESMTKSNFYYKKDDFYKFSKECIDEKKSYENCIKEHPGYFCDKINKILILCLNKNN